MKFEHFDYVSFSADLRSFFRLQPQVPVSFEGKSWVKPIDKANYHVFRPLLMNYLCIFAIE